MRQRDAGLLGIGALGGVVGGMLGGGNGVLTVPALDRVTLAMAVLEVVLLVRHRAVVGP